MKSLVAKYVAGHMPQYHTECAVEKVENNRFVRILLIHGSDVEILKSFIILDTPIPCIQNSASLSF